MRFLTRLLIVSLLPVPLVLGAEADPTRGAKTYSKTCAVCHGRSGHGDGPAAADLSPAPRDFTQGQYRFRSTPTGALPRPEDLERSIRGGLPGTAMPAFGELLSAAEVDDLIHFLYSLLPANQLEDPLPRPVAVRSAPADSGAVADGRGLYLLLECWTCHGVDGSGHGRASATLQDETGKPIHPPDFRYAPLKRGREPEAIVRTLVTGLNGTPMPSYDHAVRFVREDVADVTSFRERLPEPAYRELGAFVQGVPARAEVEALDAAGKDALHDRWLQALASYVLSLDRRHGFGYRLFHERPESEPREVTRRAAAGLVASVALLSWACAQDGSALGDLTGGEIQPTLASLQTHVFGLICADCHYPGGPGPMPLDTEQNTYDNLVNVQSFEVPKLVRVHPGDAENSYVVWKIEARDTIVFDPMPPPPQPQLSQEEIDAIRAWIDSGAPR